MRRLTATICLTLAVLVGSVGLPFATSVADNGEASGYLIKAEQYTVKVRTRVKYPPLKDNKGSFTGAGFLIDAKRGWIATNAHVSSRNPESLEVAFKGKSFVDAELLFVDRYLDLSVLKVTPESIPDKSKEAELACKGWPKVGIAVGAYGHPLSLDFSVTTGIISGLRYRHNRYWIQTDAAINKGNSGGPLISIRSSRVIGINSATYSKSRSEGIGFAVPMFHACRVFDLLRGGQNPSPPYLPVAFATGDDVPNELVVAVLYAGLPVSWPLKPGDKLVSLVKEPNTNFKNQADLIHALRGKSGAVGVRIVRAGKILNVSLASIPRPSLTDWIGLHFSGIVVGREFMRDDKLSNPEGEMFILDVSRASIGSVSGIRANRYIVTVNGISFKSVKALCTYLKRAESEDRRIRLVTRARAWDYMSASKYNLYEVKIDGVKLVGPKLEKTAACL
jgi:S1-C subfamily serine protease